MQNKSLSKIENEERQAQGLSVCEYRYAQACAWAILMGEDMPNKRDFFANFGGSSQNA